MRDHSLKSFAVYFHDESPQQKRATFDQRHNLDEDFVGPIRRRSDRAWRVGCSLDKLDCPPLLLSA
jgi:hypothetical protein